MNSGALRVSLFDPTGNITALVENEVEPALQPELAAALMRRCPEVEQVGFVRLAPPSAEVEAELRMAGGTPEAVFEGGFDRDGGGGENAAHFRTPPPKP